MRVCSGMLTLDLAPAYPSAARPGVTRAAQGPLRSGFHQGAWGAQKGFCGLAAAYRSLQRMIDARARPRAVNPPPREAPASVRVGTAHAVRSTPATLPLRGEQRN